MTLDSLNAMENAFKSAGQLGSSIAGIIDNKLREQGQIQARTMQLQYEQDAAKFLTELQNSNDYANWQYKADNFLTEYRNKLNAQCKNDYTAKLVNEQMDQNKAQMSVNLINQVNKGINIETNSELDKQMALVEENYKGQEYIDKSNEIITLKYQKGLIDRPQYEAALKQTAAKAYITSFTDKSNDLVNRALTYGMSEAELKKKLAEIEIDDFTFSSIKSEDGNSDTDYADAEKETAQKLTTDEIKKVKESVDKQALNNYKVQVQAMQDQNRQSLIDIVIKMDQYANDDPIREQYKMQGRSTLVGFMNRNKLALSDSDQLAFAERFKPSGKDLSGLTPGSGISAKDFDKLVKECDEQLKNELDIAKAGRGSYYKGTETGHGVLDRVGSICAAIASKTNISEDQKNELITLVHVHAVEYATKEWPNTLKNAEVKAKCEAFVKTIKSPEYKTEFTNRLVDMTLDMDISKMNENDIYNKVVSDMSVIISKEYIAAQLDKNGKTKVNDKNVLRAWSEIKNNNLVYTNAMGQTTYAPGIKESEEELDKYARSYIIAKGINPETLSAIGEWEGDNKHGLTGARLYKDTETGKTFRFIPSENGKDFTVDEYKNGHWTKFISNKESGDNTLKSYKRGIDNAERMRINQEHADAKAKLRDINERQTDYRVNKWNNQAVSEAASYKDNELSEAVKQKLPGKWGSYSIKEKEEWLKNHEEIIAEILNQ